MKPVLLSLWCIAAPLLLFAQPTVKFGDVEDNDVKMTSHPLDSTADAIVLMDYGVTSFRYADQEGFYYEFDRILRIKILTKDGLKKGDFKIPYYHDGSTKEKVIQIKGYSYNKNGKGVIKTKLEKSSIFDEETSENWGQIKISMPDVQVGTVIELTYSIMSPFIWNLKTWYFQDDIPTVYSEYKIDIPEYFDYQFLQSGYIPLAVNEHTTSSGSITTKSKERTPGYAVTKSGYSVQNFNFRTNKYKWVTKDVPAFKEEPYVSSPSDYISKMEFELRGTKYPNSVYKSYMGTWEALNKSFLESQSFGEAINHAGFMKTELEAISTLPEPQEKITKLVTLVKNQIEWNDYFSRYTQTTLREAWKDKKGNTADINLTIVAGLRELGFKADPVLISTRGHGIVRKPYAISKQFNSVIALVELQEGIILLDGTDRFLPIGELPTKCLNGDGWRVSSLNSGWVELKSTNQQEHIVKGTFDMQPIGTLNGTLDITDKGYNGFNYKKKLLIEGEDKFFEDIEEKKATWTIEEHKYNTEANYTEPFNSVYVLEINEAMTVAGDRIYFNPTLGDVQNENPFKIDNREYPVDFTYPFRNAYMFKYIIPEGYIVEELPSATAFAMPDNSGVFRYSINNSGNEIQIMADLKINKSLFSQLEYPVLKQFYYQVVQKCAEQIVLKKI